MNQSNLRRHEAIASLKVSVEFGADEALNEKPQNRLAEIALKTSETLKNEKVPSNEKDRSKRYLNTYIQKDSEKESITLHDKIETAKGLAGECGSVAEIQTQLRNFPYFVKNREIEDVSFYEGPSDPSVIIFKEPEIYFTPTEKDGDLFDGNLLFKRICRSIDMILGTTTKRFCGSVVTFPQHWNNSVENNSINAQLIQPFLFRHIDLLKPQAVICQGGAWLSYPPDERLKSKDLKRDVLVVNFPSLDVLRRAPKRKREVLKKILDLKKIF
tara:strand:- start:831 stop:1643 length:813 start_codon:yes stop_codon:yes gene_type:complete